jgi:hypothetical protein
MPEKMNNFSDATCKCYRGTDRIRWVSFDGNALFTRRGGKGVELGANSQYRSANTNSSTLAGWFANDAAGQTGGHPESNTSGALLPVNFGLDKTCVYPTSNRVAVAADVGRAFNVLRIYDGTQYCDLNSTGLGILTVTSIIDNPGNFVEVKITDNKKYVNI